MATSKNPSSDDGGCSSSLAEPDDGLKCLVCSEVAKDPLQHQACGKLFCKKCIEEYGKDKPCPNCKVENTLYSADKRGKKMVVNFFF